MHKPTRVAILGCGMIVRRGHLPGLLGTGKATVPVLYGPDTANSRALADDFKVPRLTHSLDEALSEPGLDAVVVALPNHQHGTAALKAIEAGLPILLEKPIASDIETARSVIAAARDAAVRISMSLPQRQRPSLIHLRSMIGSGAFGRIETIEIRMTRRAGIPGYGGWFTRQAMSGGGVLMDLGPHVIDLGLWLAGCTDVTDATSRLWWTHGRDGRGRGDWGSARVVEGGDSLACDVEDRAWFRLELASGTQVLGEVAWAQYGSEENRIRIVGDRGGADYWPERFGALSPMRIYRDDTANRPETEELPIMADHDPLDHAWAKVSETFVDDLGRDDQRLVSGTEALITAEVIDSIYRASRN